MSLLARWCPSSTQNVHAIQGSRARRAGAGQPELRAAGQQPAAGEIFEAKTVIFRFLIKNINFLLKSTQLELRKNVQTVTQKVDTNAQTHT
jgi:hypothetical protein